MTEPAVSDPTVAELAQAWLADASRPRVAPETSIAWSALLDGWIEDSRMPLLIRKASLVRGSVITHDTGRDLVPADNAPAFWALACAVAGIVPGLDEIMTGLRSGTVPVAFAFARAELPQAVFKGSLSGMEPKPAMSERELKVCHIDRVAGSLNKLPIQHRPIAGLEAHLRRFLDPRNMFVVHLKPGQPTYGMGEQPDFVEAFRAAAGRGTGAAAQD